MIPSLTRLHRMIALVIGVALASGCAVERIWEPSREEVLQRLLPSAVQVVIEQHEGRRVRTGSGVVLASRRVADRASCFVLTVGHTMTGLVGQTEVFAVFGSHRGDAEKAAARVVAYQDSSDVDLALLQTESDRCVPARTGGRALLGEPSGSSGFRGDGT